jgi:pseudaminic acid synthase
MNAGEFAEMVMMVRQAEASMGEIRYKSEASIVNGRGVTGRSLFFVENVKAGEMITEKNIRSIRPGFGLHPKYLKELIGKKVVCDVERGTPVSWNQIQAQ